MADDAKGPQGHFANEPSPGELLRAARIKKELDTKEIAATLNVDPWMLDALEHDEYNALGAPVFAKGHLRKYAAVLGLKPDDLMVAYYQRAGTREAPPLIAESILRVESTHGPRLTWLAPAVGVLLLAAVALGVFFYLQPDGGTEPARAAVATSTPSPTGEGRSTALRLPGATDVEEPADTAGDTQAQSAGDSPSPATAAVVSNTTEADAAPERQANASDAPRVAAPNVRATTPAAAAQTAPRTSAPAVTTPPPVTQSQPVTDARSVTVTLRFRSESWVEVYDRDRTKLLYGLGEAGTTRSLNGAAPLNVFLGKAGDVEVQVDGRDYDIPRISRLGTARFDIDAPSR